MPDDKPKGVTGTIGGWIKTIVASIFSLLVGAVIMYLTPLVNSAIKPAKPVANFATQVNGLTAQFNNRSTGGTQGWWDFGDGSALEPYDPNVEMVKHAYAKPGTYSVKLSLTNLIGDDSDRTANVTIDAAATAALPEIAEFKLIPWDQRERAPANYQLVSKVKNADFCILNYGDARPMEVITDAASQSRYITFEEKGTYLVRFAAVHGKQLVEQTKTITVAANDRREPMARLLVTYEAVKVDRFAKDWPIQCEWQGGAKDSQYTFRKERPAYPNCKIVSAELVNKDAKNAPVRKAKLEIAPDKSKVILTGELTKPTGLLAPKGPAPSWLAQVKVVMEKRGPIETIDRGKVTMAIAMNTPMQIPMQPIGEGYEIVRKNVTLQIWDGGRKVWEGNQAISNTQVTMNNQNYLVTATPQSESYVLTVTQPGPVLRPVGFEGNPYLPKKKQLP